MIQKTKLRIFCGCMGILFLTNLSATTDFTKETSKKSLRNCFQPSLIRKAHIFLLIGSSFSAGVNSMTELNYAKPLKFLKFGDPKLYQKSSAFELPQEMPLAHKILQHMKEATEGIGNVGIAAPQIGIFKRIVMFEIPQKHPRYKTDGIALPMRVMLNPSYKPLGEEKNLEWEGCLSVPGMLGQVPRYTHIQYEYVDLEGKIHCLEASHFHARVVQHEFDHLDGILFPMRIEDRKSFGFTEEIMASPLFLQSRIHKSITTG